LVDGLLQGVLDAGTLELRHAQRNAVHEQHRVRDDGPRVLPCTTHKSAPT
jgi:hypothetical protein